MNIDLNGNTLVSGYFSGIGEDLTNLDASNITGGIETSYIFVGDSITSGATLSSPSTQCFQAIFSTLPFCNGVTTRNVGVSGYTIANITSAYSANVHPHRPTANGGDGGTQAYLVLMIGINDAFAGSTSATMLSGLTSYINGARTDGFTVILATILPSENLPTTYPAQEGYNEAIRAGLVPYDLLWDANSVLIDPTNYAIFSDGTHPTAPAHARLAYSLQSAFMTQGGSVGSPALYGTDINTSGILYSSGVNISQPGSAAVIAAINTSTNASAIFGFGNSEVAGFPVMDWYNAGVLQWAIQLDYQQHFKIYDATTGSNTIQFLQGGPAPRVVIGNGSDDGIHILQVEGTGTFAGVLTANGVNFGTHLSASPSLPTYGIDAGGNGWLVLESVSNPIALNYWSGNSVQICPNGGAVSIGSGGLTVSSPVSATGFAATTAGESLTVKSGTNALAGTVTLSSGAATITSSAIDANTVIVLSLKTSSGTPGTYTPRTNVSAGSATVAGVSTDDSTYNWIAFKVN